LREIAESGGEAALNVIPSIGLSIAYAITEMPATGQWSALRRLKGTADPKALFCFVGGIGRGRVMEYPAQTPAPPAKRRSPRAIMSRQSPTMHRTQPRTTGRRAVLGFGLHIARMSVQLVTVLALAACVRGPPPSRPTAPSTAPRLSQAEITAEVGRLRNALSREVPEREATDPGSDAAWITLAKQRIAASGVRIADAQLIVVVDRNPRVQQLRIMVAQPAAWPWYVIGGSKVSTGQAGRRGYFITPTGVFAHRPDILDYRALGTFNENNIRGLGLKGMRVWDFGWQTAEKGWLADHQTGEIRLLMHATDPDYLEQRLGRPASQGCVRIPASMNRFLDMHGVLDAEYEKAAGTNARLREILLPQRKPTELAGDLLVVGDSSQPAVGVSASGTQTAGQSCRG
jgi:hypothetical protein